MSAQKERVLWQSGVNPAGEPFVQLTLEENVIAQFTPAETRDFALALLQAAEAAETDAFLMDWLKNVVGATPDKAAHLLIQFRNHREKKLGRKHGPTHASDWVMPFDPTKRKQ